MAATWVVEIGVWVDGLLRKRRCRDRFREWLLHAGRRDWRHEKKNGSKPGFSTQDSYFPPRRAMRLGEEYRFLASIHDATCEDTRKIWRWFYGGGKPQPVVDAGMAVQRDALAKVGHLKDTDFHRVLDIARHVAADLGVEPPRLTAPAGSLRAASASRSKRGRRTRQRARRMKRRQPEPTLTPEMEKIYEAVNSGVSRRSIAAHNKKRGVGWRSPQTISDKYEIAKALIEGNSVKAGRLPADRRGQPGLSRDRRRDSDEGANDDG